MIKVQVELPLFTIATLVIWPLAIPPVALAAYLANNIYTDDTALETSAAVCSACLALSCICTFFCGILPACKSYKSNLITEITPLLSLIAVLTSGLVWLHFRLNSTLPLHHASKYEQPFFTLWAVWLAISSAMSCTQFVLLDCQKNFETELNNFQEKYFETAAPAPEPTQELRASESRGSLFSIKRKHRHNASSLPTLTSSPLVGLDSIPEGLRTLDSDFDWILTNTGNRNISGSTQSDSLFACTNYNRQLTEQGFVKQEPIPQPHKKRSTASFSQYDLERDRIAELQP